jgi:hypothetical protein
MTAGIALVNALVAFEARYQEFDNLSAYPVEDRLAAAWRALEVVVAAGLVSEEEYLALRAPDPSSADHHHVFQMLERAHENYSDAYRPWF